MATFTLFTKYKLRQHNGNAIDLDTDDLRIALINNTTSPVTLRNSADFLNDFTECAGGTYAAFTLTDQTLFEDTGAFKVQFKTTDTITWAQDASGPTDAYWAVLYKHTGVGSTSPVIGYLDLTGPRSLRDGPINLDPTGDVIFQY